MTDKLVLARDDDGNYGFFWGHPGKDINGDWQEYESEDCGEIFDFCSNQFREVVGSHPLRKGRKAEVVSITIKLKGKK